MLGKNGYAKHMIHVFVFTFLSIFLPLFFFFLLSPFFSFSFNLILLLNERERSITASDSVSSFLRHSHRWDDPGLRSAVYVDGPINNPTVLDKFWTVEVC